MLYNNYGKTGLKVSAIGFGGMRFAQPDDLDSCAAMVTSAHEMGITYFDTAPAYCNGKSEVIFGRAFQHMLPRRTEKPFVVATKSSGKDPDRVRADLETSLQRMGLEYIDIFHVWCVTTMEDYERRKANGILDVCEKMRDQGLVRHIAISTHMPGDEIATVLRDYPFDGVLLGYCAMNFPFREAGVQAAADLGIGLSVMNPLGGGIIPRNPERFAFLDEGKGVVHGALRFLLGDPRISVSLVGMSRQSEIEQAVAATSNFSPLPAEQVRHLRSRLSEKLDRLCTGCRYCEPCPQGVPVAKMMDAYNQFDLNGGQTGPALNRLRMHWQIQPDDARLKACSECGVCEDRCTQKLPIRNRLRDIRDWLPGA